MDYFLGIDLGSTSLKAIVYDTDGHLIARDSRPTLKFHPTPETTVWDPDQIWNDTAAACRDAVSQLPNSSLIKGVAVTGMGMDGVPMDEHGNWLYPFISWHDTRTQPQFEWWINNIGVDKTFSIGGNPVWAINSALRMLWIQEHEPEVFKHTFKWLLIEDFVNYKLTGRYVSDYSMASCTMLFDQRTQNWSDEMCSLSGILKRILPDVFPSSTFLGEITPAAAEQTGLAAGTPIYLGGHDHLVSAIPSGAFRAGAVMNITGTWETVNMTTTEPATKPALGHSGITLQAHAVKDKYSLWGGNPAGSALDWFRQEVASSVQADGRTETPDWNILVDLARSSKSGAGGVMFLPHLSSSSCPVVDPKALGAFAGLSGLTKQGDLVRAVIEGLDFQFLDTVRTMEELTGEQAVEFIGVGGAIRNAFWMQNKADMVGRPYCVPEVEEATVLGAAILAGIGAGAYSDEEDAFTRVCHSKLVYEPDLTLTAFYAERFEIYRELFRAVSPVHHRLGG
ncbi:MAG: FGGY family carbohydrate kinase [Planctomycetaceae bacterium]|nr:FGGY family carbohydrate kinase [Planctomycetaceae bacterium]